MKLFSKTLLFICLTFIMFMVMNKNASAAISYKSELVNYTEISGVKEYTYDLYVEITGSSKVNHFEGRLVLNNLELVSFTPHRDFINTINFNTLEYNMTSNKIYTSTTGKLVYAQVVVRKIDSSLECKFSYEPYTYKLVTTNTFSINKEAYKDGVAIKSVKAGEEFQYKITVKSANNVITTDDVVVSDTIPSELQILSVSNSGSISGQKITWNLGKFDPGEREVVLTVNVRAKKDSKGLIRNTAILTVGDNKFQDEEPTDILYSQITIDKKVSRTKVKKDESFYYIILVKNIGTGISENVTVEDTLDADLEYISASITNKGTGNKLVFDLGNIEANQTKSIKVNVKVKNTSTKEKMLNTAIAKEDGKDPVDDSEEIIIVEEKILPDISISKRATVNEVKVGEEFSYIITIKNNNELDLIDLELKDTLDSNLEFVSAEDEVIVNDNTCLWKFDLMGNEIKEIVLTVKVKEEVDSDKVINTAILTFEDKDIPSEEIIIPIIIPEPELPPEEPIKPDDKLPDNPNTGEILSLFLVGIGILFVGLIINYIRKNNKIYKV